jgi:cysteine sulfinate desulfinase/cysteine desulfurase-like protein
MGVAPDLAKCAMRASLGWASTKEDVQRFLAVLQDVILVENTMAARAI